MPCTLSAPHNNDGSLDICFGPHQPDDVVDAAYIRTIPGRHFIVALRFYGTGAAFYDQTWRPDDLIKTGLPDPRRAP